MGIRPLNNKAVFLDRDGVINRALVRYGHPYPPPSLDTLEIQPDVPKALNLLKESEFLLIVVTNQPDVGRGTQKRGTVEKMHTYLLNQLPLDDIYVCWEWTGRRVRLSQAFAGDAISSCTGLADQS